MVWEQRWHPLRREWVIISSHRNERPWLGERVAEAARQLPAYVPDCYLCPGNARSSGKRNEQYGEVRWAVTLTNQADETVATYELLTMNAV